MCIIDVVGVNKFFTGGCKMACEIIYDKCFAGNFKLLGFATGAYFCKCSDCGKQFVGDKLSFQCLECAIKIVEEKLTSTNKSSPKIPKSYKESERLFLEWWHTGTRADTLSYKNMHMFYEIVVGINGR